MTLEELRKLLTGFLDVAVSEYSPGQSAIIDCLDSAIRERDELKAKVDMYEQVLMQSDYDLESCPECGKKIIGYKGAMCANCFSKLLEKIVKSRSKGGRG